jgi:hypothetical protein
MDAHGWRIVFISLGLALFAYIICIAWFLYSTKTEYFLTFGSPILVAAPLTPVFSRYWLVHKKRVPYWIAPIVAGSIACAWLVCVSKGLCFTSEFWSPPRPKHTPASYWIEMIGMITVCSTFSALAVIAYYHKDGKRVETFVA